MAEDAVKKAVYDFLRGVSRPLDDEDFILISRAESLIRRRYAHGFNQLASVAFDARGNEYQGIQMDAPIGQHSVCAEVMATQQALIAGVTDLTKIVTVRHQRPDEGDEVHVVPSCPSCCSRLLHFFPAIEVICWVEKDRLAVPVRALVPLPFKTKHRANGNGNAVHHFEGVHAPTPVAT